MEKFSALSQCHDKKATVLQEGAQTAESVQKSKEIIHIKDSCEVTVTTTDTQAAVNLQVAIQLAIALVLSITIADSEKADRIAQELFQRVQTKQVQHQKTVIENSRGVTVTTTDTEAAVNIQVLAQILVAIVAKVGIL